LSLVVLPFANLGDPRQDYFAEGVTDSLITDLSRALPGSFVVARGTAFTYKSQKTDAAQVGRDLNVRYVLIGSILSDMDWVRVNAQLIDAQTNVSLWAERFDKKRTDVLMVQDQIVGRLARSVGLQVIDLEARRSAHSSDPLATDFVMRGQVMANRQGNRLSG
jgi:TolB-like protein